MSGARLKCPTCGGLGYFDAVFGDRLRDLGEKNALTQEQMAKVIGVSRPQVANLEAGWSQPTSTTLLAVANHFNVSVDWLLGREPAHDLG